MEINFQGSLTNGVSQVSLDHSEFEIGFLIDLYLNTYKSDILFIHILMKNGITDAQKASYTLECIKELLGIYESS